MISHISAAQPVPTSYGIEMRGVGKTLRGRRILRDVDLAVPRGTIAVLEGDNGAGKTTLIRILATVVSPDEGTALVDGKDVRTDGMDVRRSIGVSFANERSLYWRLNAYQNLELFGKISGLSKRVIARRSTNLVEELHLQAVANGMVARMSTGQRQRLMVARALLNDPSVLLLDEPFRGLDEQGLDALCNLVVRKAASGTTMFIVAPLIAAVTPIADSSYRIDEGTVRPVGLGLSEQLEQQ